MFFKKLDKKIETYQRELIDIHHQEVETMYKLLRSEYDFDNHVSILLFVYTWFLLLDDGYQLILFDTFLSSYLIF